MQGHRCLLCNVSGPGSRCKRRALVGGSRLVRMYVGHGRAQGMVEFWGDAVRVVLLQDEITGGVLWEGDEDQCNGVDGLIVVVDNVGRRASRCNVFCGKREERVEEMF